MGTTISGDTGVVFPDATTQSTAVTVATPFSINASAGAGAQLRLPEATANGVNYVAVKAADALSSNVTFTLPTADGTSGQFLQTNGSGALTFATVAPAGSTGQVQYNNAGAFGALPSGTSGQALISQGAGAAPTWGAAGAMTLISTQSASGASSLSWTGLSVYNNYMIVVNNLAITGGTGTVQIQFGTGSGPTYVTSGYYNAGVTSYSTNVAAQANNNVSFFDPQIGSSITTGDPNQGFTSTINVMSMRDGNCVQYNAFSRFFANVVNNYFTATMTGFLFNNTTVKTAIRILPNSGTFSSGTVSLYGIST